MYGFGHQGGPCGGRWAAGRFGRYGGRGPGWGAGPGGGGGSEWFRIGRMLAHGDLKLLALALIAEQPRHGYELIKLIEEKTGGWYSPSPGVVYPTLTFLEEAGYVTAENEGAKKRYTITEEGRVYLEANRDIADMVLERWLRSARSSRAGAAIGVDRTKRKSQCRNSSARRLTICARRQRSGLRARTARPRRVSSRSWRGRHRIFGTHKKL